MTEEIEARPRQVGARQTAEEIRHGTDITGGLPTCRYERKPMVSWVSRARGIDEALRERLHPRGLHRFHSYNLGNQLSALFHCFERGIRSGPLANQIMENSETEKSLPRNGGGESALFNDPVRAASEKPQIHVAKVPTVSRIFSLTNHTKYARLDSRMELLSTQEVCQLVGIHPATLERWLSSGRLHRPQPIKIGARVFRYWTQRDVGRVRKFKEKFYRKGRGRKPRPRVA